MSPLTSVSSQDRLDIEEFSLRQNIERLVREVELLKRRKHNHLPTQLELENYQRRLVLYQENRTYESKRRARRQRMLQRNRP